MESFKKRLRDSIQLRLSFVLCTAISGIAIITGTLGFISALDEARELQDSSLQQIASLVREGMLSAGAGNFISPPLDEEKASNIVVHFISPEGQGKDSFPVPVMSPNGFSSENINGHAYRLLIENISNGFRVVVAQRDSVREHVAFSSAVRTLIPFFILIPVLLYLVADLVKKIFRPISQLAEEVNQQSEGDHVPLAERDIPAEIMPFIQAINRLLNRSAKSVELQRRFVADAAHELRSPLTALMLQSERLEAAELAPESRNRVLQLRASIRRAANLVEQLLSLSRAQSGETRALPPAQPVEVFSVIKQVISDLYPLAEEKRLDIGVIGEKRVEIITRRSELFTLFRNIIHNAIIYTPHDGRVDIEITEDESQVIIAIEDSGPGIPADQTERVFDAFYRIEGNKASGSGLGLSIVSAIIARMQGKVVLTSARGSVSGLNVTITLQKQL